ncbi:MAG: hypothetical protein V1872_13635, partial [bacterium]
MKKVGCFIFIITLAILSSTYLVKVSWADNVSGEVKYRAVGKVTITSKPEENVILGKLNCTLKQGGTYYAGEKLCRSKSISGRDSYLQPKKKLDTFKIHPSFFIMDLTNDTSRKQFSPNNITYKPANINTGDRVVELPVPNFPFGILVIETGAENNAETDTGTDEVKIVFPGSSSGDGFKDIRDNLASVKLLTYDGGLNPIKKQMPNDFNVGAREALYCNSEGREEGILDEHGDRYIAKAIFDKEFMLSLEVNPTISISVERDLDLDDPNTPECPHLQGDSELSAIECYRGVGDVSAEFQVVEDIIKDRIGLTIDKEAGGKIKSVSILSKKAKLTGTEGGSVTTPNLEVEVIISGINNVEKVIEGDGNKVSINDVGNIIILMQGKISGDCPAVPIVEAGERSTMLVRNLKADFKKVTAKINVQHPIYEVVLAATDFKSSNPQFTLHYKDDWRDDPDQYSQYINGEDPILGEFLVQNDTNEV